MINEWKNLFKSGELLLLQSDSKQIVFLNRTQSNGGHLDFLRYPINRSDLPEGQALRNGTGIYEGLDYQNVRVITADSHVKGSNWMVIAKVNRDEIFHDVRKLGAVVGLTAVVGFVGWILLLWLFWHHARQERFSGQYEP